MRKASKRLIVEKEGTTLLEVPLFQVDRIMIFGSIQISTQAIGFLLDNGIDVSFLSFGGRLKGRLVSTESKNVFLRLAQHDRAKDEAFKLRIAKRIIEAKAKNQRTLIYRYQRNHPEEAGFSKEIEIISEVLKDLPQKKSISSLMGLEGASTGAYYRCFGRMIRKDFSFEKRTRRPPLDPVNALLSLGYVMITNEIAALLESTGFDPLIGFLHGFRYGRQSLPLDLVEEFRHPVVDGLTLTLLNKGSFKHDDFYQAEDGAYSLKREAFRRYLTFYEEHLDKPRGDDKKSFRDLFKIQVEKIEKAVLNNQEYDPFLQWEID